MELLSAITAAALSLGLGFALGRRRGRNDAGQLLAALDAAPVSICVADADGQVLACAGGAVKRAGYRPADVVGAPLQRVIHPDGQVIAAWESVRAGGGEQLVLHRGEARGSARYTTYLSWFGPLRSGVAMINLDATAALSEADQRQLQAIGQILGDAHDRCP